MNRTLLASTAAAFLLSSGGAFAQSMVTATSDLNVRAGPGPQYPVVGMIGVDTQADLEGCEEASKWCLVSVDGMQGWAYSDYLIAEYQGRDMVVTERVPEAGIPVATYERSRGSEAGGAAGLATGAVAGALIAGPLGAAVGGIAGGAVGGSAGSLIDPPRPEVREYVESNRVDPVYLDGEVVVGAGLPDSVPIYDIPEYEYRYVYVNGQPVLVEPDTRRIVYVIR